MSINLNDDVYFDSGESIAYQDIPLGLPYGLTPVSPCRACLIASPNNSAVYGDGNLTGTTQTADGTSCPSDDDDTGSTTSYRIIFSGTPKNAGFGYCYTSSGNNASWTWKTTSAFTIPSTVTGAYFTISATNYANLIYYKSLTSPTYINYTLPSVKSTTPYIFQFHITPSASTIYYGWSENSINTEAKGTKDDYSVTIEDGVKHFTILSAQSAIYLTVKCDGYLTCSAASMNSRKWFRYHQYIDLPLQTKYTYCILVRDKKTGTALSGVTITKVSDSFVNLGETSYTTATTTNENGAVFIWSYSAVTSLYVTAIHRGYRRLMTMSDNAVSSSKKTEVAVNGIGCSVTHIFDLDYCYEPCAYAYDEDENVCSRKGGVTVSYSSATVSLTTVGTTDSTSADGYGLGEVAFYCQDPIVYVKGTLDGYIDYTVVHNEANSPSSNTVANFGLWMYVDYYTGMTINSITMSNAKGLFNTACGVEFSSNYSRYDGGPYFPMDEGTTLLLEKSDKGKTLTLVFTHRGAGSITKQITIPARTNRSLKTYNTGISVAFTGFNRTLTFGDLYNAEPAEEDYAYAGYDDGVNVTGKLLYEDNNQYATYRGGDPVSSDEVLLLSDVDHYDAQPTN
jgi:hypothetical protein